MTEAAWGEQFDALAVIYGWAWVHFRPARTAKGWRTPVSGPLGKGWPDRILVKPGRAPLAVELKGDGGRMEPEQREVLRQLGLGGFTTAVFWPSDVDKAVEVLSS